jgi:hypothetical protein
MEPATAAESMVIEALISFRKSLADRPASSVAGAEHLTQLDWPETAASLFRPKRSKFPKLLTGPQTLLISFPKPIATDTLNFGPAALHNRPDTEQETKSSATRCLRSRASVNVRTGYSGEERT